MPVDRKRVEQAVRDILEAIGDDPERAGIAQTPARVAEAYSEFFAGIDADPVALLGGGMSGGAAEAGAAETSELVVMRDIAFRSVCEHHLLPFTGVAHVAYRPAERVVGFGRILAVVSACAARPQMQERLTEQIADALDAGLTPRGVLVVLDASHQCVTARGLRQTASTTVTSSSRGELRDPVARAEVLGFLNSRQ